MTLTAHWKAMYSWQHMKILVIPLTDLYRMPVCQTVLHPLSVSLTFASYFHYLLKLVCTCPVKKKDSQLLSILLSMCSRITSI